MVCSMMREDDLGAVLRVVLCLRHGVGAAVAMARCASSRAPPPGPCHSLSPVGAALVITLGQGHGDAHPCMPQVCTEAWLSEALGGASVFGHRDRRHKVHHPRKVAVQTRATLEERTCT